nr:retrovirus-related Pol polyprotein from transposon TNT 1-94 [Tanacetum cinerariifolium]
MTDIVPPIPPPFGANTSVPSILVRAVEEDLMSQMSLSLMKRIFQVGKIGPSDIKDTKIIALRLKFNAFRALKGENGTFTRLRSLLNNLENNGVLIPQAEVNATFVNSLRRKWLSMNQTQRANNSIKNHTLAALYGKYNYEEGLIDQIYESKSTSFTLYGSKALISNPTLQESDSDIEEDQRSSIEFLADLNDEFHERALLANQRRFYKRTLSKECPSIKTSTPQYPSSSRLYNKPKFHTNTTPQLNQNVNNNQKDYSVKYKGLNAEIVVLTKKIDAMNKGKSEKRVSSMAIADEPSLGRADSRSGQWVEITMNKRKNLLSKYNSLKQVVLLIVTLDELLTEQILGNIVKAMGRKGTRKEQTPLKEVFFTKSDVLTYKTNPEIPSDSESEGDTQRPLPTLPKLFRAKPSCKISVSLPKNTQTTDKVDCFKEPKCSTCGSTNHLTKEHLEKTMVKRTLAKFNAQGSSRKAPMIPKPYIPCKYYGFNDHHSDECEFYPGCDLCGSIAHETTNCPVRKGSTIEHHSKPRDHFPSINEYSRYTWVFSLKRKSDSADCIISFIKKIGNLNEEKVKELRSDNGTELKNHKLEEFCDDRGISQNFSSPCTLEQNGVAERKNKTLIEAARTMLNSVNLPKQFWGEAVNTACYTQNKSIIVKRHGKTAYDVFRGRSPNINYFHVFRCPVHIQNYKDHLGKFDEKADDGFFLGYSLVAKAFRVFNIKRQEMKETYHVTFIEDDEVISQSSIESDAINFNEIRIFPDDEFQEPKRKPNQESGNNKHLPYVPAYDPLSSNNISIPECLNSAECLKSESFLMMNSKSQRGNQIKNLDFVSPEDHAETSKTNNDQVLSEPNQHESGENLKHAEFQTSILNKQTTGASPTPLTLSKTTNSFVPQDRWSRDKHRELVNIIGEPLDGVTTRSKIRDSKAASAHECLYVNFFSQIETKRLIEALEEEGWIIAMQEELNQFERNKV